MKTIIDEELFTAETIGQDIAIIRIKRHLVENLSHLIQKESFFTFLDQFAKDDKTKCIVIIGNPDKRGAKEIEEWHEKVSDRSTDSFAIQRFTNAFQQHVKKLIQLPQIILYGDAGNLTSNYLSIGLAADYFALADCVKIHNTNAKYDELPAGGATYLLSHKIGKQQTLSLLTEKKKVSANTAYTLGICDAVTTADELEEHLIQKAKKYTTYSRSYLSSLKKATLPDLDKLDNWFKEELDAIVRSGY